MGEPLKKYKQEDCEIVKFPNKKDAKLTKAGFTKMTPNNSIKGESKTVYPLKKKEDIEAIKKYYLDKKDSAKDSEDKQIAGRDLLIFIVGINSGLRMSDILKLTWGDIFYKDESFKEAVRIVENKTEKFKDFYLNNSCKTAFNNYIEEFGIKISLNNHIFRSREGGFIDVNTFSKSIKKAAIECGIKFNVATHTCRKTWAYNQIMAHQNDAYFMAHLMNLLNHSSISATLHYAGIEAEQYKKYYDDVNL